MKAASSVPIMWALDKYFSLLIYFRCPKIKIKLNISENKIKLALQNRASDLFSQVASGGGGDILL